MKDIKLFKELRIQANNGKDLMNIGNYWHNALKGKKPYINSEAGVGMDSKNLFVTIWADTNSAKDLVNDQYSLYKEAGFNNDVLIKY